MHIFLQLKEKPEHVAKSSPYMLQRWLWRCGFPLFLWPHGTSTAKRGPGCQNTCAREVPLCRLWHHLKYWCSILEWQFVSATQLPIQLPASVQGRQKILAHVLGPCQPHGRLRCSSWLLASAGPIPGRWGGRYWKSWPANGEDSFLSLSLEWVDNTSKIKNSLLCYGLIFIREAEEIGLESVSTHPSSTTEPGRESSQSPAWSRLGMTQLPCSWTWTWLHLPYGNMPTV